MKSWLYLRIPSFILFASVLISCASSGKFLGTRQPSFVNRACPVESEFCTIGASNRDWVITGKYYLDRTDSGTYHLYGSVKLDVTKVSVVFQSISKLDLTFVFLQGDLVVHEEKVRLRGGANEYIEFSHFFDTDNKFASSAWAWWNARVTELPATSTAKKPNESLNRATYIRIESVEQIYEDGQPKFTANPGDILEVIRVKTCISGSGTCWQVRNTKTGETGFRRADVLKQRHTVYEEIEGSTDAASRQTIIPKIPNLSGTYRSDITTRTNNYYFKNKEHRKMIITLEQDGNNIVGTNKQTDTKITGIIEGASIKYKFYSSQVNPGLEIKGEWKITEDGSRLEGSWTGANNSGSWNLTRIE